MTRVVLDTNVVISALLTPAGSEAAVLLLGLHGAISLYVSTPVFAEYEAVLARPKFRLEPARLKDVLVQLRRSCHFVEPTQHITASPDEADNRFLECAEEASADFLVTGNRRHFPKSWKGTQVVSAQQLLAQVIQSDQK